MRTLLLGLVIVASTFLVSPAKSERPVTSPESQAFHCPLTCGREVTCADGRVFCNCCLAKQAGEKNCSGC